MDLPVALRYRQEFVKGCSCKQAEYNPTEIEAANKKAQAEPAEAAAQANAAGGAQAPAPVAEPGETPELDLEITGSTEPAAAERRLTSQISSREPTLRIRTSRRTAWQRPAGWR